MALNLDPLASSADLSVRLGIEDNDLARWCVDQISARFRGATGNSITLTRGAVLELDSPGRSRLALPVAPLVEVTSVTEKGVLLAPGVDYEVSKRHGLIRRLGHRRWAEGYECIVVVCSHGYAVVPDEIQEAVIDEASILYNVEPGLAQTIVGDESLSFAINRASGALGMSDSWAALVTRYTIDADL